MPKWWDILGRNLALAGAATYLDRGPRIWVPLPEGADPSMFGKVYRERKYA